MSTIDWKDPRREDELRFVMVDPHNLELAFGELKGVILDKTTLSFGYYTDTRASGSISFADGNLIDGAWIRVIHKVPAAGYQRELGTFIPTTPGTEKHGEGTVETRQLQSILWGIKDDLAPAHFNIAKQATALKAFAQACKKCRRPYIFDTANDYAYTRAKAFEIGESYLSILFNIANTSGNRVDVDGHGNVVLSNYVCPIDVTPTWTLDADSRRTIIKEKSIKRTSTADEVANRTIVLYTSGEKEISGSAELDADSEYSQSSRGYTIATLYSLSSLKPATAEAAGKLAAKYLKDNEKNVQWTMETMYFPGNPGDTVNFRLDRKNHICMIQSIDPLNLGTMTMKLTLKELK